MSALADSPLWYLARSTGITAFVLLTLATVLGLLTTGHLVGRLPRFVTQGLHRTLSLTAVGVLLTHVVAVVVDGYVQVGWLDTVVPFISGYQPLWVGLGVLALDLLLLVAATSLLRNRIGHRAWRTVHYAAYATWPLAMLHFLTTGTDAGQGWAVALAVGCAAVVAAAAAARFAPRTVRRGEVNA